MKIFYTLFLFSLLYSAEYKPLSEKDKVDFANSYDALIDAWEEQNFHALNLFAPSIIEKHKSILLDPGAKDLRTHFNKIDSLYSLSLKKESQLKTITQIQSQLVKKNYKECLQTIQTFGSFSELDSLYSKRVMGFLINCQKEYSKNNGAQAIPFLNTLSLKNQSHLNELELSYKDQIQKEFFRLTVNLNRDSILAFRTRYPGILTNDVQAYLNKSKDAHKSSVLKRPSVRAYMDYFAVYQVPDKRMSKSFDELLYKEFAKTKSIDHAERYIKFYPNGLYRTTVKTFIQRFRYIEEQERQMREEYGE